MTDNEIVKALKELLEIMLCEGDLQRSATISKALDLINRQKEENERLERQAKANEKYAESLKRGIEVLGEKIKTAKSEARKEFAERLLSCYEGFDEKK